MLGARTRGAVRGRPAASCNWWRGEWCFCPGFGPRCAFLPFSFNQRITALLCPLPPSHCSPTFNEILDTLLRLRAEVPGPTPALQPFASLTKKMAAAMQGGAGGGAGAGAGGAAAPHAAAAGAIANGGTSGAGGLTNGGGAGGGGGLGGSLFGSIYGSGAGGLAPLPKLSLGLGGGPAVSRARVAGAGD